MSSLVLVCLFFVSGAAVPTARTHLLRAAPQVQLRQQHSKIREGHSHTNLTHGGKKLDQDPYRTSEIEALEGDTGLTLDYGDLTCMKWTGGLCHLTSCKESRGPTDCLESRCMCRAGHCANAVGECEPDSDGEWLGTYAFSFQKAYVQEKAYIGAEKPRDDEAYQQQYLVATADSNPQWKIALSPRAHVRFESTRYPGNVLSIYANRRRRSETVALHRKSAANHEADHEGTQAIMDKDLDEHLGETNALRDEHGARMKIGDDDDLWPVLEPLSQAHPIDLTFRVRPTAKDGGGYEIWDPHTGVALSSADPDWYFGDAATDQGMAECYASKGECDGRQLVNFEPKLPHKATPLVARDFLSEHRVFHWWQIMLLGAILPLAFCVQILPAYTNARRGDSH